MPPRKRRPPRPGALADLAPLRILRQIILLQIFYYGTALVLLVFAALAAGKHPSVNLLLGWESLRGDITEGWMFGLVWMLNSLITVLSILVLVARSKLVPDFAITIHFIHLVVTSFYSRSIPMYFFWWSLQIASTLLMISLGIWGCQWRELRPISFGGKDGNNSDRYTDPEAADQARQQVHGVFGLGSGWGRSTAKASDRGTYEMLPIGEPS